MHIILSSSVSLHYTNVWKNSYLRIFCVVSGKSFVGDLSATLLQVVYYISCMSQHLEERRT